MALNLDEIVFGLCSWCGRRIAEGEGVIPLGVPFDVEDDAALIGKPIEFSVDGFLITGFLFPKDSEEKTEGFDIGLIACSDDCANRVMECAGTREIKLKPLSEVAVLLKTMRA